ncbi:T9SS type A sorting domain-containing protein [Flavobacterium sp. LMO8]|uniref:T9SS type A sorting domain-containing protein n=1 Tax=Flavobacterium sp. LMO8 TaxID=2654244 RepID=UPI0012922316|nr:T9SS type A sorting domain-containing protein [Flavobacterium sp. LMO8]MQP23484.1 T9SS type A sorting domain-containing protein [Flavobacterium sp. LMO8]
MKKKLLTLVFSFIGVSQLLVAQVSDKENVAKQWIKSNFKEIKVNSDSDINLRFVRKSISGETLRFQQMVNNVPVFDTEIVVHFNPSGEISFSDHNITKEIVRINTTPQISNERAIEIADKEIGVSGMVSVQESNLVVYNKLESTILVYRTVTNFEEKPGSWEVIIDAMNGSVLSVKDISINCGTECTSSHQHATKTSGKSKFFMPKETNSTLAFESGTAMVFLSDPLSSARVAYGGNYTDGNGQGDTDTAELNAQRVLVNLPEVENTAGTYLLKSSYVEIKNIENPNKGLFTQATPNFLFTRNADGFEAANVFYSLDNSLRYINETLGVNCRPFRNAGILWFDPSGQNGADNSRYSSAGNDLAFGEGCVDDGEDGDVIWHELGHGLHDWLTGGSLSQVNGLSEGTGDYWAQSHSRALPNQWNSSDAAYHWMFNWDGHNACWGGRTTNYAALYPGGLVNQVHTDGQIWATVNMKIWDRLGREKTDTAFLEGLALTNSTTNQQNAAIAVRQAAIDMNYSCADIKVMTEEYTAKGYVMPAIALRINCPGTQTVNADVSGNYTLPSFASLANAINSNCDAVVTQNPPIGSVVGVGTHVITMTATSGASVNCNFNLVVESSLGVDDVIKNNFSIYPNPASTSITIKGENFENEEIEIYNMLGQRVIGKNLITNESTIDISNLANGVYMVYFLNSKASHKFVKQ